MEKSYYSSPIGNLEIVCKNDELVALKIVNQSGMAQKENDFIRKIKCQLEEYFSGKRQKFDIKTEPQGTEFQKRVWAELQKIPYGKTKSYAEIAQDIGNANAQRAVGSACNKNPVMIVIPCHRVVSKNGELGGFAYGVSVKQKLLGIEHCADDGLPLGV